MDRRQPGRRHQLPAARRERGDSGENRGSDAANDDEEVETRPNPTAAGVGEGSAVNCRAKSCNQIAKQAAYMLRISGKRLSNYGNIVCFERISKRKMLLVERHLLDIAANLPEVMYQKRYGL